MAMRPATTSSLALYVMLAVVPSLAQTVYSNGPTDGNADRWAINFGFAVSDTFNVTNNATAITGFTWRIGFTATD